ncbi:DMT family transporter [Salinisphaera sp. USBA-960]|nr:DMT family transporter [Salifodinibacter halophilus]NNC27230.1 DMT family transporter [Salifodinibacter halophilus]
MRVEKVGSIVASGRLRLVVLAGSVVFLWGISSLLREIAARIPALELTAIALAAAACCSACFRPTDRKRAIVSHRWYAWLIVPLGLVGGAAFYFAGLEYAPPEQVVVITYTWPLLFALASDLLARRRPAPATLVGLFLGLAGVAVMHGVDEAPAASDWLGYLFGLAAGVCWVVYSVFVQRYSKPLGGAYPAFLAVGALVAIVGQALTSGLVWPSAATAITAAIVLGVGPYGLGFLAWSYVIRNGNPRIVPVLPYAVPVVAAVALVLCGQTAPTPQLALGCGMVFVACASAALAGQRAIGT